MACNARSVAFEPSPRAVHESARMSRFLCLTPSGVQLNCRESSSPERLFPPRRAQAPARALCHGNFRVAVCCLSTARAHSSSLLAHHPLERALTVASPLDPLLVVVLGPTASGKTALSLAIAERFQGEIVNCDSVAMYRRFDIGTAKPTAAERARAPHHLIDCVDPTGTVTAGEYSRRSRAALEEIKAHGHLPIVVGGTGLYLRALLEGLFPGPQRSEKLRERLRELAASRGSAYLQRLLRHLDRAAAEKIHANDTPKLVRAIEVCLASRQKITELWQQQERDALRGFRILRLGLDPDRQALYERINDRAQVMFENGLVEETRSLIEKYGDAAGPLSSLGYRQAVQLLHGELTREQAIQAAQQAHRNYAKRQMTWFRREPKVYWLRGFGDDARIQRNAADKVKTSLATNLRGLR
jgi:tRNA dimethylallyltransferase